MDDIDVEQASRALVDKLDAIFASNEYLGIFSFAMAHGMKYTGANCEQELNDLRAALGTTNELRTPSGSIMHIPV